jgi:hypothetical protein
MLDRSGISTVVNLQLPWEHSRCGPGMESSGFTYQPEELMNNGGTKNNKFVLPQFCRMLIILYSTQIYA